MSLDQSNLKKFASLHLSTELLQVVEELGFHDLTPIQAEAIPLLLAGHDLVGQSKTGSGKTAAFTLPILQKIEISNRRVQSLILCPTRELCTQVAREVRKLGRRLPGLQVLILAGGQPIGAQIDALEKGTHIAVGTPGRVIDHLGRRKLDLRNVATVVLDEADRMLDMGFKDDMEEILGKLPASRQTVFFSATYPKTIAELSKTYQRNAKRVTIDQSEESSAADSPAIQQIIYQTHDKFKALFWVLKEHKPESAIVFCNLKASVKELTAALTSAGVSATELHGDLEQSDRDRVMAKFRNKSTRVLVATDVAARGIDVENLDLVVNYEFPKEAEIYVHRIGRTGRAGKEGLAVTLASYREKINLPGNAERKPLGALENFDIHHLGRGAEKQSQMMTLYISGGRKDKVRPGDILGALTGEAAGLNAAQVGKIEIHDRFSYVAVAREVAETALERLRNGRIKGRKFRIEPVR